MGRWRCAVVGAWGEHGPVAVYVCAQLADESAVELGAWWAQGMCTRAATAATAERVLRLLFWTEEAATLIDFTPKVESITFLPCAVRLVASV